MLTLSISHNFDDYTVAFVGGYQDTGVFSQMDYQWSMSKPIAVIPLLESVVPVTCNAFFSEGCFPQSGSSNLKSLDNACNCVVLVSPDQYPALTATAAGNRYSGCGALESSGLPVVAGIARDLDGNPLQNLPEYALGAQYTWQWETAAELTLRVDYYWQEEIYTRLQNRKVDNVDSWNIRNAQPSYTRGASRYYARAYVKNIADDDHIVGHYFTDTSSGNFSNVFAIEPRTYRVAVGYSF
jgi:hypothetical protein